MRLAASVILLAVLLVLAGCMGKQQRPPFDQVDADVRAAAMPLLVQDHGAPGGHYDAAAHRGSLNLEMVAHHNGVDETGDPDRIPAGGYYTELDIEGDYVYLARHSVDGSSGGFVILDISDVRAGGTTIRKVGEFVAQGGADIEVTPEGGDGTQYAFFATQRNTIEQLATGVVASGDPAAQAPRGIHIVDISDRVAPQARGFYPLPYNGPHTITYHRHANGQEYVIASTYDFLGNTVPSSTTPSLPLPFQVVPVTQKVLVLQFLRPPPGTSVPALLAPVNQ
ncbi:MAG TPA: hypothetical protein VFH47_05915, partial [Candidatus Thermoplasmatota archaeon]|nr:hypothetical protein [Candidatus Thermoplasmatota archaeon]